MKTEKLIYIEVSGNGYYAATWHTISDNKETTCRVEMWIGDYVHNFVYRENRSKSIDRKVILVRRTKIVLIMILHLPVQKFLILKYAREWQAGGREL